MEQEIQLEQVFQIQSYLKKIHEEDVRINLGLIDESGQKNKLGRIDIGRIFQEDSKARGDSKFTKTQRFPKFGNVPNNIVRSMIISIICYSFKNYKKVV